MSNANHDEQIVAYRHALGIAVNALIQCKTREHIGAICRTPAFVDKKLKEIDKVLEKIW